MRAGFVIFVVFLVFVQAANAIEPVRVRADAKVVDIDGRVIGVPNKNDSRNNKYETFYQSIDKNGNYSNGSTFKVAASPHGFGGRGYIRIDVASEEAAQQGAAEYAGHNNDGDVQILGGDNSKTSSLNNDNINKSRYDFGGGQSARYGDF